MHPYWKMAYANLERINNERSAEANRWLAPALAIGMGLGGAAISVSPTQGTQASEQVHDRAALESHVKNAAAKEGIPEEILMNLVQQESNWNINAKSQSGAMGIMQLMPGTAEELGVDPYSPVPSIYAGAKYLKQQYNRFNDWNHALRAYNWGGGNTERWIAKGMPEDSLPKETREYTRIINPT